MTITWLRQRIERTETTRTSEGGAARGVEQTQTDILNGWVLFDDGGEPVRDSDGRVILFRDGSRLTVDEESQL